MQILTNSFSLENALLKSLLKMSEKESEEKLHAKKPGTYLFREDDLGNQFFSGIDSKGEVHHCRIEKHNNSWTGANGSWYKGELLQHVVCTCLDMEESQLEPLFAHQKF